MPKHSTSPVLITAPEAEIITTPEPSAEFDHARSLQQNARLHLHAAAGFMVLWGIELKRLKKLHGDGRGGDRKSKKSKPDANRVLITWADRVQAELGITDDTAAKYIAMADAAKERLPILQVMEQQLLTIPLPQIEAKDQLIEATLKLTSGHNAKSFMQECGIAKPDPGMDEKNRHKGGNDTTPGPPEAQAQEKFLPLHQLLTGHRLDDIQAFSELLYHLPLDLPPGGDENAVVSLVTFEAELKAWHAAVSEARKRLAKALHASREPDPARRLSAAIQDASSMEEPTPPVAVAVAKTGNRKTTKPKRQP